jgi:putative hemolysin
LEPPSIESLTGLLTIQHSFFALGIPLIIIGVLLFFSALISGSEVAFFSLGPSQREDLEKSKKRSSTRILKLLENPKKLLATILITNNFVNVAIIILSSIVVDEMFPTDSTLKFFIQVVAVTFLILLLGEVIPKVYATKYAVKLAGTMSGPLGLLQQMLSPLSKLLIASTSIIDKRVKKKGTNISVDELEHALELTSDENTTEEEHKILKGIVKFGNTDVKQIMKPRTDVLAFENETLYEELIAGIIESGFSRLPIYKESFDQIVGILYTKDLLPHLNNNNAFKWQSLIRSPFFVPENKKIDDLLKEFQESKVHMAIVVDEYGGTSGIVTLEDVIEEIVGDITDEFDDDDLVYSKLDESNYVFEGKTPLIDIYRILSIDGELFEEVKGESDTIAGFLIEQSGKILKKHEKVNFENYTFVIEAADKRKIKQVKMTINPVVEGDDDEKKPGKSGKNNLGKLTGLFMLLIILFAGCTEEVLVPKEKGYLRVDFPEKRYKLYCEECPFQFEIPEYTVLMHKETENPLGCNKNLQFPRYNATLHISYFDVESDSALAYLINREHGDAYEHRIKSTGIDEKRIIKDSADVYGLTYDIYGNAACNYMFYLTDSTNRFFRATFYFNAAPNVDSVAPILKYIKEDIEHLVNTFEWKNRIIFPQKEFKNHKGCAYSLEVPNYTTAKPEVNDEHNCIEQLQFNNFSAGMQLSYASLTDQSVEDIANDYRMSIDAMKNDNVKILESIIKRDNAKVHGRLFNVVGKDIAPEIYLYLTDSTNHFLTGTFRFENVQNDTILPYMKFLDPDIRRMLKSFSWQ